MTQARDVQYRRRRRHFQRTDVLRSGLIIHLMFRYPHGETLKTPAAAIQLEPFLCAAMNEAVDCDRRFGVHPKRKGGVICNNACIG